MDIESQNVKVEFVEDSSLELSRDITSISTLEELAVVDVTQYLEDGELSPENDSTDSSDVSPKMKPEAAQDLKTISSIAAFQGASKRESKEPNSDNGSNYFMRMDSEASDNDQIDDFEFATSPHQEINKSRCIFPTPQCGVMVDVSFSESGQSLNICSYKNIRTKQPYISKLVEVRAPKTSCTVSETAPTNPTRLSYASIDPKRLQCVGSHFPEVIVKTQIDARRTQKLCVVCSYVSLGNRRRSDGIVVPRHRTTYQCEDCKVPLCIVPRQCFRRYHTMENYFANYNYGSECSSDRSREPVRVTVNQGDSTSDRGPIATDSYTLKRLECTGEHFPVLYAGRTGKPCKQICAVCNFQSKGVRLRKADGTKHRHRTRYKCSGCQVALCISPRSCFQRYHKMECYFHTGEGGCDQEK